MEKNNKKKVLRVISRLNIGGPAIHIAFLSNHLDANKYESVLVIGTISPQEGDMSYLLNGFDSDHIYKIEKFQREIHLQRDLLSFFNILKIILIEKPDIVHTHMAKAGALARSAAIIAKPLLRQKIKIVHTYHGNVLEGYFGRIKSKLFTIVEKVLAVFSDAIIAISDTQKFDLTEKFKICHPAKVQVINLGFDLSKFGDPSLPKGFIRRKIGVDESVLIGIVGRLVPIKNHYIFFNAARIILDRFPDKSIMFVVVGDGELKSSLQDYAMKISLDEHLIFWGWEKEIELIYADLDIVVLTSLNEGTPVSLIEAMASMVPIVTTDVGGIRDLLGESIEKLDSKHGFHICERGIICRTNDATAIANGIEYTLINGFGSESDNLSKARDYVQTNYSDYKLLNNIENLYDRLLSTKSAIKQNVKHHK